MSLLVHTFSGKQFVCNLAYKTNEYFARIFKHLAKTAIHKDGAKAYNISYQPNAVAQKQDIQSQIPLQMYMQCDNSLSLRHQVDQ